MQELCSVHVLFPWRQINHNSFIRRTKRYRKQAQPVRFQLQNRLRGDGKRRLMRDTPSSLHKLYRALSSLEDSKAPQNTFSHLRTDGGVTLHWQYWTRWPPGGKADEGD